MKVSLIACTSRSRTGIDFDFDLECDLMQNKANHLVYSFKHEAFFCVVENFVITHKRENMTSAETVARYDRLDGLMIYQETCFFIPIVMKVIADRLALLYVQYSNLKEIVREDLAQFPKIQSLDVSHNDLEVLRADLFNIPAVPKHLRDVNFGFNKLKAIASSVFDKLNAQIYLTKAGCVDREHLNFVDIKSSALKNCSKPEA